ncbi:MAG TPA: hypothetical protein QGF35_05520 [Dehalococcoidia bacterium]|nr:hypothetical protein [Dehalococcoidia bacterium]
MGALVAREQSSGLLLCANSRAVGPLLILGALSHPAIVHKVFDLRLLNSAYVSHDVPNRHHPTQPFIVYHR